MRSSLLLFTLAFSTYDPVSMLERKTVLIDPFTVFWRARPAGLRFFDYAILCIAFFMVARSIFFCRIVCRINALARRADTVDFGVIGFIAIEGSFRLAFR